MRHPSVLQTAGLLSRQSHCKSTITTYVPPEDPCTFYMCDTGEWVETIIDCFTSCATCEPFCVETGGTYTPPLPGDCCGACEGGTEPFRK